MAATVDATLVPRLPTLDFSPSQEAAFQEVASAFLSANFHGTGRPGSAWAAQIGLTGKRVPPRPLAAGGH